jgi:hypothetical protein
MANLTQIAQKFRVSENFLNSKEDGLIIVSKSIEELIGEMNLQRNLDENRKQSIIEKLERLSEFCKEVKNSSF